MLATVSIKGQVTVPKQIRDRLNIGQGTRLDFTLNADGSVLVRPLVRSAQSVVGLLRCAKKAARTVEEMNSAMGDAAAERHARTATSK